MPATNTTTTTTTTTDHWLHRVSTETMALGKKMSLLNLLGLLFLATGERLQRLRWSSSTVSMKLLSGLASHPKVKHSNGSTSSNLDDRRPCIPRPGLTAITIGQDFEEINAYSSSFATYQPSPFALMSYTSLNSKEGNLTGLMSPVNYGSGIQWMAGLSQAYPRSALQLGLWIVDQTSAISNGHYDDLIEKLAIDLNTTGRPIYLRIGYEFDNPSNRYLPNEYKLAFQRIVRKLRKMHVHNVAFVWHSAAEVIPTDNEYLDWYPGDDFVDWCGVSIFQQPFSCQSADNCFMIAPEKFASFCDARNKPLMIAESTPFGGILDADTLRKYPNVTNGAGFQGSTWNAWFIPVLEFIRTRKVRMWSYINCNWDSLPMYQSASNHAPGVRWGDSRLQGEFVVVLACYSWSY
jgi:hypothetical protein